MLTTGPAEFETVYRSTEEYLAEHPGLKEEMQRDYWAIRAVADLVPQTIGKVFSGHFFPISQAEEELRHARSLASIGFYQHAILGLRWVLELGCLSVYWDRSDAAENEIKPWLKSRSNTPFKRQIVKGLLDVPNIKCYADQGDFLSEFDNVYGELSSYAHVQGVRYSSRTLLRGNVLRFQADSFLIWHRLSRRVVKIVVAIHLLKYPVGTQYTPLSEKFGLNGPAGGFIEPYQLDEIRRLFTESEWSAIRAIGDADEQARSLAEWVESLPDITDDELQEQSRQFDRDMVENSGFGSWHKMYLQVAPQDPELRAQWEEWVEELRTWAAEHGWLEHGRYGPLPEQMHPDRR